MKTPVEHASGQIDLDLTPAPSGYRSQALDTSITADRLRFHLYRQRSTVERLLLGAKFRQNARKLLISGEEEYERLKLDRRRLYTLAGGGKVAIASPEDLIISKLLWRRTSQSDKQWRDILGVLKVQQEKLDFEYVRPWVDRFGLAEDWERAKLEAGISHLSTDSRS